MECDDECVVVDDEELLVIISELDGELTTDDVDATVVPMLDVVVVVVPVPVGTTADVDGKLVRVPLVVEPTPLTTKLNEPEPVEAPLDAARSPASVNGPLMGSLAPLDEQPTPTTEPNANANASRRMWLPPQSRGSTRGRGPPGDSP